ncbi:MAG TPA: zinc-ribbon domain-containing protein, partial [Methanofastidiosum sp.]|nr:zinc-ribbon domain-containing protein [Methanofastidiosum sp.]
MEKIKCLSCGNENSKNSVYCENCGASLFKLDIENEIKKEEKPRSFNKKLLIIPAVGHINLHLDSKDCA